MKKHLILVASLLLLAVFFCACGESGSSDSGEAKLVALEGLEDYKLVRSDTSTEAEKDALVKLHTAIHSELNVLLKVATDYSAGTKEILVGKTSRQQSIDAAEGLRHNDYVIKQDGNKIVIVGGSDESITAAVDFFIENYINKENGTLMIPDGNGLEHIMEYKLDSFIIGDVDIKEFKIKPLYEIPGSYEFSEKLKNEYIGFQLPIEEKNMIDGEHYIVIDNSLLNYGDYNITVKDGNIYISGSYASIANAMQAFFDLMDSSADGNLVLASSGTVSGKITTPEIPYKNKDELLKILEYLHEDDRLIFGQHLAGNLDLNSYIDQYTEAVGEGPAIMDIDFLNLRTNSRDKWSQIICQAVDYAAKGGVLTTMHHWLNPLHPEEGFRGRLDSIEQWGEVLTKGSELNLKWHEELDRTAECLKALQDAGVSVMFRPMHEANGNWFWFCAGYGDLGYIDSRDMIAMWEYVYDYYTKDWGLDNILWSYAPNVSNSSSSPVTYYYPGDEYCDVVGLDWYTGGEYEIDGSGKSWDNLLDYRKPTGLTEWGIGDSLRAEDPAQQSEIWSCEEYVETLERMRSDGKAIAFAEVYNGRFGAPSYVGKGEALANYDKIISLEEMPSFIKEVLGK